jgi:YfiH family protein
MTTPRQPAPAPPGGPAGSLRDAGTTRSRVVPAGAPPPQLWAHHGGARWAFSDRTDGTMSASVGEGDHRRSRTALAAAVGVAADDVAWMHQVHGAEVHHARPAAPGAPPADGAPACDGIISTTPGLAAAVLVADCVPVLLADVEAGVVAAAHAGRKGFVAGVLEATLVAMAKLGARPGATRAAIGPAAGPCCYEVPGEMRDEVGAVRPAAPSTTTWGTPSLDLRGGCAAVLREAGVADVVTVGGCTIEDDDSFSFRRAGVTGRFAGVVRLGGAP